MIAFSIKSPEYIAKSERYRQQQIELEASKNREAFVFLMASGTRRLQDQNYQGAHSEFKAAHALHPTNEKVKQLLMETLMILCEDSETHCLELDQLMRTTSKP